MEMSRQRLRTGVLEASTRQCPHCEGTGLVRTASSSALSALRMLEDEAAQGKGSRLLLRASQEAAIYVLNRKRAELAEIEERYGVAIDIFPDSETEGARMTVEASGPPPAYRPRIEPIAFIEEDESDLPDDDIEDEDEAAEAASEARDGGSRENGDGPRKRSRRRRGRRGRREEGDERSEGGEGEPAGEADEPSEAVTADFAEAVEGEAGSGERKRSRRGRRGGRGRRADGASGETNAVTTNEVEAVPEEAIAVEAAADAEVPVKKGRRRPSARKDEAVPAMVEPVAEVVVDVVADEEAPAKPKRSRKKAVPAEAAVEPAVETAAPEAPVVVEEKPKRRSRAKAAEASPPVDVQIETVMADDDDGKPRRGWWQRTFGADE